MKKIGILGSTGSIGVQSLDVARMNGYTITMLSSGHNIQLLEKQIREFHPLYAAVADENKARELKLAVADTNTKILGGEKGIAALAAESKADIVINAIVGLAGLAPTLAVLESGTDLALANKESLVAGGALVKNAARQNHARILPVDSEHSAIFQCLQGAPKNRALKKIILTASGGPFFGKNRDELKRITVEQALHHPNWNMGAKITVDSATMFNKGLELIEAVRLFDVKPEQVDILVHRESIVHSLIEYDDNSVLAQLGLPDMRIPIQYALTYPDRLPSPVGELDLTAYGKLSFYPPDYENFPCINICKKAIKEDGLAPAAVNSANEEANLLFRQRKINFLDIPSCIEYAAEKAPKQKEFTADDIFELDRIMREEVDCKANFLAN